MGVEPLTSQAFGAGDPIAARRYLWQGVWMSCAVGIVFTIPIALSPLVMPPIGIDADVTKLAKAYLWIRMLSLVPMLLFHVLKSYLQARGVTRPMIVSMAVANVFNLAADIVLVFGAGPIPPLGVAGAAIATVVSSIIQLGIIALAIGKLTVPAAANVRKLVRSEFVQVFRIGFPVGLHWGAEVGVFALVALLAGRLGAVDLAAHQIAITLASFTFMFAVGVSAAASVRVGRSIGALDHARTRIAGLVGVAAGAGVMAVGALAFLLFPGALARLLSDQPDVIAAAIPLIMIAAVFQVSDGMQATGAGVLRGAGDTRFTFLANLVGHWLVGFPIAILLGFHLGGGVIGLWWGLCAGLTAVALILVVRFLRLSSKPIARVVHVSDNLPT